VGLTINPETDEIFTVERFTGNVYTVDAGTGAMDLLGMPTGAFVSDLALPCLAFPVPEPGTLTVLALGLRFSFRLEFAPISGRITPHAGAAQSSNRIANQIAGGIRRRKT
jgi:hypothetical protein